MVFGCKYLTVWNILVQYSHKGSGTRMSSEQNIRKKLDTVLFWELK